VNKINTKNRLSAPFMYAFRASHAARDGRQKLDVRDDTGERVIASHRAPTRAAITEPILRREVMRDLDTLMNTIAISATLDMERLDYARRSILNFGFPDVGHRSIDETSVDEIRSEIADVLRAYEPRILTDTIQVERDESVDATALKVRFRIHADLSCDPAPVPLELVADIEVDTGKIVISRS